MAGKAQRSKPTRSRPARPVQKRYPESRLEQMVLIGVGAVLVIAAIVVLVGLFITQYLPPRAHVLTVEGREYDAAQVKERGSYMIRFEQDFAEGVTADTLVDRTIDRIIRDEVLRLRAPAVVGDVTEADVEQQLRVQLGFATPTPTPAPSPVPGTTATSTPAATATEVITPSDEERQRAEEDFARAQQDLYRSAGLDRDEYISILTAQMLEDRLREQFQADLGTTAPQIKLEMIRVADEPTAQRVRDQALQGSDFVRLAAQYSITPTAKQDGGELGWQLVDALDQQVRDAVEALPAGGVSEIIRTDDAFEIYKVTEAKTDRELDSEQLDTLLTQRMDDWFAQETPSVQVERDLSEGEEDWLVDAIVSDAQDRGAAPTPSPASGTSNGQ